jgi:hypothetical protein
MSNPWFDTSEAHAASGAALQAELAESDGDASRAKELYREAASSYTRLALSVTADHPQTRSALGVAAVACHARAGDFGKAIDVARRLLAQSGALSQRGRTDLLRMVANYNDLISVERKRTLPARRTGIQARDDVRANFVLGDVA